MSCIPWGGAGNGGVPPLGAPLSLSCVHLLQERPEINAGRAQKRRAAWPDHFIGTLFTGACPGMWGFVWEKSKQKGIFSPP